MGYWKGTGMNWDGLGGTECHHLVILGALGHTGSTEDRDWQALGHTGSTGKHWAILGTVGHTGSTGDRDWGTLSPYWEY